VWYQSPRTTVNSPSYLYTSFGGWITSGPRSPSTYCPWKC
jgi:hypothetical protein